jgi:hypothetical protein
MNISLPFVNHVFGAKDEGYTVAMKGKRGLEIEFSKHRR